MKVELQGARDVENMELRWKAARQIQQELLEKKLLGFLSPIEDAAWIKQYPRHSKTPNEGIYPKGRRANKALRKITQFNHGLLVLRTQT